MTVSPAPINEPRARAQPPLAAIAVLAPAAIVAVLLLPGVFRSSSGPTGVEGSGVAATRARHVTSTRSLNGSGRILVTATGSLDASVPGSGTVVYTGRPAHVTTSISGTGAITRG